MNLHQCLEKIEKQRQEMHQLAEMYGFSDERVLDKSQQLDLTLNEYNQYAILYKRTHMNML